MQGSVFSKSAAAAGALFILGNAVMFFPTSSGGEFTLLGFLAAAAAGIILYICVTPIYSFVLSEKRGGTLRIIISTAVFAVIAVASLFIAADSFRDFIDFASNVILPKTSRAFIIITFLAIVVFFGFKRQEDSLKFSLICFGFTAIAITFFFLASIGDYEAENIRMSSFPDWGVILSEAKPYFMNPLLPALLLPFYYRLVFKGNKNSGHFGLALGLIFFGLCILSAVLLFGTELSCRLSYPYASAISTISIGRLYTRLDGFSYFIYFASALTKINICVFLCFSSMKKINSNLKYSRTYK